MKQTAKKNSLIRSMAFTLAGFLIILFTMNLYQYFRVKSDIAATLVREINEKKLGELRTFLSNIKDKLNIVRDWGKKQITIPESARGFTASQKQMRFSGHLYTLFLINQHIGAEFSGFININLIETEDKKVVMIDVKRAGQPVFLRIGKNEEFYIRSGPSSVKLSPSQMLSYVMQNKMFKKKE